MFNSIDLSDFSKYIKQIRLEQNLTQLEINRLTGINADTIRRIEIGQVVPRFETLAMLSSVYKVDLIKAFSDLRQEKNLIALYNQLDICLMKLDISSLIKIREYITVEENFTEIYSNLINKIEYFQFCLYLDILILYLTNRNLTFDNSILVLQKSLSYTVENFSITNFEKHKYNFFEIRILLLYALIWANFDQIELSNKILKFILNHVDTFISNSVTSAKYKIKLHFNLSYNFHRLDSYEDSLEHANLGIEVGRSFGLYNELYPLYYRKFVAEYHLNLTNYSKSLRHCFLIMDLIGNKELMDTYIDITQKLYQVDLSFLNEIL